MTSQETATFGAFFMEGLMEKDFHDTLAQYEKGHFGGCVELVSDMCDYAAYSGELLNRLNMAFNGRLDFPGVFEYEVCVQFGEWYGEGIRNEEDLHSHKCMRYLREQVFAFFQRRATDEVKAKLREVLV